MKRKDPKLPIDLPPEDYDWISDDCERRSAGWWVGVACAVAGAGVIGVTAASLFL